MSFGREIVGTPFVSSLFSFYLRAAASAAPRRASIQERAIIDRLLYLDTPIDSELNDAEEFGLVLIETDFIPETARLLHHAVAAVASAREKSKADAEAVVRSLMNAGVPSNQLTLTVATPQTGAASEVRIFVRLRGKQPGPRPHL